MSLFGISMCFFKDDGATSDRQLEQEADPDDLQLNELEGWNEVVTRLHPPCTFQDYIDVVKVVPMFEQLTEEDIMRSTQTPVRMKEKK
jgi:hypothetical protein